MARAMAAARDSAARLTLSGLENVQRHFVQIVDTIAISKRTRVGEMRFGRRIKRKRLRRVDEQRIGLELELYAHERGIGTRCA